MTADKQNKSNQDPEELKRFSALAGKWWDLEGEFAALHQLNPVRLQWITKRSKMQNARVLDIGCGGGILTHALAKSGAEEVTGIDLAEKSLKIAKLQAIKEQTTNTNWQCISAEELATKSPNSFDIITCMEMLEHVPDPASIVKSCWELAKPDADIFFSTISRTPKSFMLAIAGAEYIARLVPRGTHTYSRFINPAELASFCTKAGLEIKEIQGVAYNPFSKNWTLTNDTKVNYFLHAKKRI